LKSVIKGSLEGREAKPFYSESDGGEVATTLDEFADSRAFNKAASLVNTDARSSTAKGNIASPRLAKPHLLLMTAEKTSKVKIVS